MKKLLFNISILFSVTIYGQSDSTSHLTLLTQYSFDRASANGATYRVYSTEAILKSGSYTAVPTYRSKTIQGIKASQYGMSFYRSFEKSYMHMTVSYSSDRIFPSWNIQSDYYQNIKKGIELRLAYNYRSYSDNSKSHLGILGLSYERNRIMIQYNAFLPLDNALSHQLSLRRLLKIPGDYIQLSYTHGRDNNLTDIDRSDNHLSSYRLSFNKRLMNIISLSMTTAISDVSYTYERSLYVGYTVGIGIDIL